jgi:hypothetical protein
MHNVGISVILENWEIISEVKAVNQQTAEYSLPVENNKIIFSTQ